MPLRVGVVSGSQGADWGGGGTLTAILTEALKSAHSTHEFLFIDKFLRPVPSELPQASASGVAQATSSEIPQPKPTILELMEQAIGRERLDLVWYMAPDGFPLSIPYIATVWDLEHRKQPYFPEVSVSVWPWAERELNFNSLLPRASIILTGTEVGKKEVVKYYGVNGDNVAVIPFPAPAPPVDLRPTTDYIRAVLEKYAIKGSFLLYPAQFWPHKNHVNLLMSLAALQRTNGFRPSLVLTGRDWGNRQHVRNLVHKLNLSERVFDLGFVSREELNCLYAAADALVFPSFFGPDNLPPLEAFALGCPVIAADIPGAQEQLGRGALYFDPSDPEQIAARILEVCRDADCRHRLIKEGALISRQRSPQAYVSELCKVLDGFEVIRRCWGERYEAKLPGRSPDLPRRLDAEVQALRTALATSERDRADRLDVIKRLDAEVQALRTALATSEQDRVERLKVIKHLDAEGRTLRAALATSEQDRADRLEVIKHLSADLDLLQAGVEALKHPWRTWASRAVALIRTSLGK
jgi:glycosyltransferase involved in cell wall biosynthesis